MSATSTPWVTHVGPDGVERAYFENVSACEVWIADLDLGDEDVTSAELEEAGEGDGVFLGEIIDALGIEGLYLDAGLQRYTGPISHPRPYRASIHQTTLGDRNGVVPARVCLSFFTDIAGAYHARAWVTHVVKVEGRVVANVSVHHRRVAEIEGIELSTGRQWELVLVKDRTEVALPNGAIDWTEKVVLY